MIPYYYFLFPSPSSSVSESKSQIIHINIRIVQSPKHQISSALFPLTSFVENRMGRRFRKEVNLRKYQTVRSSPCHLQTPRSTYFSECFLHCFSQSFLTRRSVHLICVTAVIAVHILQYRGTVQWKWCYLNCTAISSYLARTVTHFLTFWPGFFFHGLNHFDIFSLSGMAFYFKIELILLN